MREIKFRAWDKKRKEMSVGELSFHYDNQVGIDHVYLDQIREVEDYILMQYTGLKDINGKEIYEGDMVKTKWQSKAEMIWVEKEAAYGLRTIDEEVKDEIMYGFKDQEMEVIGNIYENKDLLK
jgi:uncharacterized phage protein (TIGR01671 family)